MQLIDRGKGICSRLSDLYRNFISQTAARAPHSLSAADASALSENSRFGFRSASTLFEWCWSRLYRLYCKTEKLV